MLHRENLKRNEVLWIRFGQEDPAFDYELLGALTYHPIVDDESVDLLNKYVKGQEFSLVVVEGLPRGR